MAAACGSLQHIFNNALPETPNQLEPFPPWTQTQAMKPEDQPSVTELFGELHFRETSEPLPSSCLPFSPAFPSSNDGENARKTMTPDTFSSTQMIAGYSACHKSTDSFSLMNSERLHLCTEGLGSESSDDLEDKKICNDYWKIQEEKAEDRNSSPGVLRRPRARTQGAFPPPISCIGNGGRPCVCFKSYRQDGRLVLEEIKIPTQEFLHACRQDGRLKLSTVPRQNEFFEEEAEEEEEEDEEREKERGEDKEESLGGEEIHDVGEGRR